MNLPSSKPASDTSSTHRLTACCFESRLATEMRALLQKQGITATQAPSLQEVALEKQAAVEHFANQLLAGQVDILLLFTGVGTRMLFQSLLQRDDFEQILERLRAITILARGPKPTAALKEQQLTPDIKVANPFTWQETWVALNAHGPIKGQRIAVQEYGAPDETAYEMLAEGGAEVLSIPIYRWELPDDLGPLEEAITQTIDGQFQVLMFTSAQQIRHVLQVAERLEKKTQWLAAASKSVIASIGPTCSAALREAGLPVDIEPDPPKMGPMARQVAEQARALLQSK